MLFGSFFPEGNKLAHLYSYRQSLIFLYGPREYLNQINSLKKAMCCAIF